MTGNPASWSPGARTAFALNAVCAWTGVVLTAFFSGMGWYDPETPEPGLYGGRAAGAAGALPRLADTFSYFTLWSNVVVALSLTLLLRSPAAAGVPRRVLRLAGLVMITVTAIVYHVLLAPITDVTGWSRLTNPILHVLTPAVTVLVWLVWGPHGWFSRRVVALSLVPPLLWIGWMLTRGAVFGDYPYGFVNVDRWGYAAVSRTLAMILLFGLAMAAVYGGLDRALGARRRRRDLATT